MLFGIFGVLYNPEITRALALTFMFLSCGEMHVYRFI